MKVVVNKCYGGFGLSDLAYERLIELGIPVRAYTKEEIDPETGLYKRPPENEGQIIFDRALYDDEYTSILGRYWDVWTRDRENRTHPLIIRVVEELGDKASGRFSRLRVVEIPDDVEWEIDDYDGIETIHEVHRSW